MQAVFFLLALLKFSWSKVLVLERLDYNCNVINMLHLFSRAIDRLIRTTLLFDESGQ